MEKSNSTRLLWFDDRPNDETIRRAKILEKHNFSVALVASEYDLKREASRKRTHIIVVSIPQRDEVISEIQDLILHPEIRGAKWILSLKAHDREGMDIAAGFNFRDMIPLNLPDKIWLYRMIYAGTAKPMKFQYLFSHLAWKESAKILIPCRFTHLWEQGVRIESQIVPQIGDRLFLEGKIFEQSGIPKFPIVVSKITQHRLAYRFIGAIEGKWRGPASSLSKFKKYIFDLSFVSREPKKRILAIAKNEFIRQKIFLEFSPKIYECLFPLKFNTLILESSHFDPDLIFIEGEICTANHKTYINKLLKSLDLKKTSVFILSGSMDIDGFSDLEAYNKIHFIEGAPSELSNKVETLLLEQKELEGNSEDKASTKEEQSEETINKIENICILEANDPTSFANFVAQVQIATMHVSAISFESSVPIVNFSLVQIQSDFLKKYLKKDPWLKIIAADHKGDRKVYQAIFMDLDSEDKKKLSQPLLNYISKNFSSSYISHGDVDKKASDDHSDGVYDGSKNQNLNMDEKLNFYQKQIKQVTRQKLSQTHLKTISILKSKTFLALLIMLLLALSSLFITTLLPSLEEFWDRSGKVYSDQISKFSGQTVDEE